MLSAKIGYFRPTGFDPRSISGLAVWLDGADTSTLYTTDAGSVTAVSSPTEISGCVLWLDGADASTVTASGGSVSEWRDKTAGARHFTASGAAQPTYTATLNGRNVLTFNGSTNTLAGNAAAQDTIRNRAGYTFFAVSKVGSVAAGERLICGFGSLVVFRAGQNGSAPYAGGRRLEGDGLENITGAAGSLASGSSYITSAIVNHTLQSIAGNLNGSGFASDSTYMAAGNSANAALLASVGSQSSSYGFYNGDIAEVIIFDTSLSTADRARVEAYLATKWGIANVHTPATATSDPVGYWADKSGNNRHVTQATAASRPTVSGTLQNGRRSLAFNGTSSGLSSNPYLAENGLAGLTRYAVLALSSGSATIVARVFSGGGDIFLTTVSGEIRFGAGSAYSSVSSPTYGLLTSGVNIVGSVYDGTAANVATGIRPFYNGALLPASSTSGTLPAALPGGTPALWIGSNIGVNNFWPGRILEYITYSRALTTPERQRLERYLASKWGITLAPQVSNADAQSWIDRVYANGGTVSTSTASAVNTFCNSIDASGIRNRFYRLNLFAGTGLAACLVPLYRGQSLGGTQFGNATDTNSNFVSGDYAETGSTGGLKGNGTSKYLNTGIVFSQAPVSTISLSAYAAEMQTTGGSNTNSVLLGSLNPGVSFHGAALSAWWNFGTPNGRRFDAIGASGGVAPMHGTSLPAAGFVSASNTDGTNYAIFQNGTQMASASASLGVATGNQSGPVLVFTRNDSGSSASPLATGYTSARVRAYHIGTTMTAAQHASFYSAMQAFQTALSRNV